MECFSPGLPHNPQPKNVFFGTTACKWEQTGLPHNAMSAHIAIQIFLGQPPVNQDIFLSTFLFVSISDVQHLPSEALYARAWCEKLLRALNKPEVQYYWSQVLRYSCNWLLE